MFTPARSPIELDSVINSVVHLCMYFYCSMLVIVTLPIYMTECWTAPTAVVYLLSPVMLLTVLYSGNLGVNLDRHGGRYPGKCLRTSHLLCIRSFSMLFVSADRNEIIYCVVRHSMCQVS